MACPPRIALIVPLLALAAAGCSTSSSGRNGSFGRWRTMATSGGTALPTESGRPGSEVAVELGTPEAAPRASGKISGRVMGPDGRPVANAEVRLADGASRVGRDLLATTDDAGGFTLRGLREGGPYTLIAEGDVGREAMVGRATARAPSGNVRIRLGPEGDGTATADAADEPGTDRRVGRVSTRDAVADEEDDPAPIDEPIPSAPKGKRPGRINGDDLPPAEEAEALDPSTARGPVAGANAAPARVSRAGWKGVKADPEGSPPEAEPLKRPSPASTPATKRVEPPKAAEEDEKNPLPPAKERPVPPLSPPAAEPVQPTPNPAPETSTNPPKSDPPVEPPPPADATTIPDAPPSSLPSDTASIPAEAAPRRRATWGDVSPGASATASTAGVASASPLPMSTRRPASPGPEAARAKGDDSASAGRRGNLALKGKKPGAKGEAEADVPAASCRYDARTQRIVDFQLPDLDGKPTRFADLDADFVLIDFWGTWCKPCVGSIPHLIELQKQYGPKTLRVVGVATEHDATTTERAQRVDAMARSLGINYPLLLSEADGRPCPLQEALHIQAYPTMILVDRTGKVLWRGTGAEGITLARLDRVIAARADTAVLRR